MLRNLKVAAQGGLSAASRREPPVADAAIDTAQPVPAAAAPERRIGAVLREMGKLDESQVQFVLEQQAHSTRRFGDLAVSLGMVSAADVDRALALLHAIEFEPAGDSHRGAAPAELSSLQSATSGPAEALRALRSQLMLRWFGPAVEQHTLAIVSPDAKDGRTHICAALAVLISQMDEDVLLIDADLRRPRLHSLFGVDNTAGLSSWLQAPSDRPRVFGVTGYEHLHLLPSGPAPRNPNELVARRQFGLLLESLAQRYAFVLIDTPPAMQSAEALTVAVRSSGCLLVTRRHRSRIADMHEVAGTLGKHGVEVVGAVVNDY